ncbi:MAG: UDP-2,3-diacylglucosamine diphosphatase [Puniceicoccaceae bacterium]|nr:MAG: UDP-2,3-diacylglucosamine diphosphatase [Puniceicoccaceae bacterium]
MKKPTRHYRTIVLSDVHLGTPNCKVREVNHFLKHTRCRCLILNGDIIDGWQLRRSGRWTRGHTKFVRQVLKKLEKKDSEVIYLRGNHDDILARFLPLSFGRFRIVEDYIHLTARGERYLVLHGDVFDSVVKNFVFLAHLGDFGYRLLLTINRFYNRFRALLGKEYYSLSAAIKARVKKAVSHISNYEEQIVALAEKQDCVGVLCGHIHTAADKRMGSIHYLNSGDWVESMTAVVEHHDGRFELIRFEDFRKEFPLDPEDLNEAADFDAASEETSPAIAPVHAAFRPAARTSRA